MSEAEPTPTPDPLRDAKTERAAPRRQKKKPAEPAAAEAEPAEEAAAPKRKSPAKKKKTAAKKSEKTEKAPAKAKKKKAAVAADDDQDDGFESGGGTGKALVVVESPAKAKTINKFLGKDYIVKASMGHVRDLPKRAIGIELSEGFVPEYEVLAEKKKVVTELKRAARDARAIYLACDNDREGEAIAWHISEILRAKKEHTHRVTFNEITKSAIERAFASPRQVDMDKVNAQQARRVLDRIVGYKLSPLLWKKVTPKLSAGRVQSVAVKLVVEREKEIKAFVPTEYWELEATLDKHGTVAPPPPPPPAPGPEAGKEPVPVALPPGRFFAKLQKLGGEKLDPKGFRIQNEAEATQVRADLEPATYKVASVEKAPRNDSPSPPFITSTLQQQASTRLRFGAKKTMSIAQQLYEGVDLGPEGSVGLITYMRTDSFNLAKEAVDDARAFVREQFGEKYVPDSPRFYKTKDAQAQEAHEAIRPSNVRYTPDDVARYLSGDQLKLYRLIWERFVGCQMPNAVYEQTTVDVEATPSSGERVGTRVGTFRATGRTLIFDGHTRVSGMRGKGVKDEEAIVVLPELREGETLALVKLQESQHFTQPPPRYSEASLVQTLEKLGIGRPSTYAAIVSTIQDRGYVTQDGRRFHATELGRIVTEKLEGHFQDIMDYGFTSDMESRLDRIEDQKLDWLKVLADFYTPFMKDLKSAEKTMKSVNEEPKESNVPCPKCGRLMVYKYNKRDFNRFLGCPGYEIDGCKETMPVDEKGEAQVPEETDETCPECGSSIVIRTGKRGRFRACAAWPKCTYSREVEDEGKKELLPGLEMTCEECGKKMVVRRGRRGPFLGCTGYPECKSTRPIVVKEDGSAAIGEKRDQLPEVDEKCPRCNSPMKIRRSRRGPFLGCSAFPKCRGTKPLPDHIKLPEPPPPRTLDESCDQCGKPLVVRMGRRGPFAACSGYPQCKNTKPLPAGA